MMESHINHDTEQVPECIQARLDAWHSLWKDSVKIHYLLGGLSVAVSALSAAIGGTPGRLLAAVATVLTALIGFVQPERCYLKSVKAWRVLDLAVLKFKAGLVDEKALLDALDRGETLITDYESKADRKDGAS